jgi:hypothetical protein
MTTPTSGPRVQALLLADHIYFERETGKHVIAGTFHQINLTAVPTTFTRSIGLFLSLAGLSGPTSIDLEFVAEPSDTVLMRLEALDIEGNDSGLPVAVAVELPPLPLPQAGRYRVQVLAGGRVLGATPVLAVLTSSQEES